jgi:LysR family transcriptional activator of mexEF-oprN operon
MDIAGIDLNLLRVFDVVNTERSVTRAAMRLSVTQSAVSNSLARLRRLFGDELFVRTPLGMEPTALACEIAPPITAALEGVRTAIAPKLPFDPATACALFSLGMSEYAEHVLAPSLVGALRAEAPGVDVAIRHVDSDDSIELLDRDRLDLAVGIFPEAPAHMTQVVLLRDGLVTLMRADHPLAARGALSLDDFLAYPHVLVSATASREGVIDRMLAKTGRTRRLAVVAAHLSVVPGILAESDLLCSLSSRFGAPLAGRYGLVRREPPLELPPARLSMIWHLRDDRAAGHVWLRRRIAELARGAAAGQGSG